MMDNDMKVEFPRYGYQRMQHPEEWWDGIFGCMRAANEEEVIDVTFEEVREDETC